MERLQQKKWTANITATKGAETAICKVNVVYSNVEIDSNKGNIVQFKV